MTLLWKIDEGTTVKLKDYDPDYTDKHADHDSARAEVAKLGDELSELQELLAGRPQEDAGRIIVGV